MKFWSLIRATLTTVVIGARSVIEYVRVSREYNKMIRDFQKACPELEHPWVTLEKAKKLGIVRRDLMPSEFTLHHAELVRLWETSRDEEFGKCVWNPRKRKRRRQEDETA